jgi:ParB/RepB/Spo0J family partition protein
LFRGQKPDFIQAGEIITQREQEHNDFIESYENPIEKAMEYARMIEEENLSQNGLAKKLGISRVRVTQILNLLKLPDEQQRYIIKNGKMNVSQKKAPST